MWAAATGGAEEGAALEAVGSAAHLGGLSAYGASCRSQPLFELLPATAQPDAPPRAPPLTCCLCDSTHRELAVLVGSSATGGADRPFGALARELASEAPPVALLAVGPTQAPRDLLFEPQHPEPASARPPCNQASR